MLKQAENIPTMRMQWDPVAGSFQTAVKSQPVTTWFIKGPLPLDWIERAAALPGKVLHVALALWFQMGLEGASTVKLGQKRMSRFSVSRDARYDALRRLVEAGLIEIQQLPGQAPLVTVVHRPIQAPPVTSKYPPLIATNVGAAT